MLWSQNQERKQRPWEESARVPMLFRLPASLGISPRRLPATLNTEDVMPTLLSLCGLPIPKSVEGLDFSGAMRGGPDPSGGATLVRCLSPFGEFTRRRGGKEYRSVRTATHTYVRDLSGPWLGNGSLLHRFNAAETIMAPGANIVQDHMDGLFDAVLRPAPGAPATRRCFGSSRRTASGAWVWAGSTCTCWLPPGLPDAGSGAWTAEIGRAHV